MNVVLIGFSGSGKSTVGELLARSLGHRFVDTDVEIERVAKRRIHEIFASDGEAAFRKLESAAIAAGLGGDGLVVAVGGGAVVDPANVEVMRRSALVIQLEASESTLYDRLREDVLDEPRPMLYAEDPLRRIAELKGRRDPLYRSAAHMVIETDGRSLSEVVDDIVSRLESMVGTSMADGRRE